MKIKLAQIVLLILFLFSTHTVYAETIFIFNPEARISKIKKVKIGLEKYLRLKGINANIYIFANPKDFQDSVIRLKPELAIIASYFFNSMKNEYKWKAALSGHKKGAKHFSKILVTLKSINHLQQLKNKGLAAVSLGLSSLSYLDSQLPSGLSMVKDDVRIVSVSKDIDAIMALGFEQVQAAIVTKESFNKLKKINPDTVKNLHILQKLTPTLYSKVVVFPHAKNFKKLVTAIKNMSYKSSTKIVLRFFDVTGFISTR